MIGSQVPDIEVEAFHDEATKKVNLRDYKGQWLIVVFYPADFTFVCPTELEELANLYDQFKQEGAEIASVSTDTVFVHKAWHDHSEAIKKIRYPMLADPTGKLCKAFGTYLDDEGLALRGSFIVDPDGVIKAMELHDNSLGRSADELLRKLKAAKFVRENPGQVCPANWQPGKNTLKPGLDLVGKI
ncbi:MAG: alkyl hydroperoxide reductase subunit C [Candidatus Woesearchaeota archaeon]|jgi:peroxiredoxin (alkyl hydroperoxide reductase subunit C)|nr:alkyl hydroperoxide reductase subunit C [Candidatus Woesearchaeota archaeon]MDP7199023.1 alkyl hydroperoxide reductase subunit C [Candidatus Woesearchaeota archaeon]MDP7467723.1 alkyl hydroperoxide reductase subunit C [Candidatus Woesearchaeota archaeon]MDP7646807.1 alkyl hydroperoxide reductase subunit C [Candidatus Woesearchaeota archaeon]